MKTHMVLSATGRDRVGVADQLSDALAKRSIRIEDSRWTAVGGRFSVIVQVCGARDDVARLRGEFSTLRDELGFDVQLAQIEPPPPSSTAPRFLIECFASGPPDMNAVTGLLRRHGVNIDHLETEISGEPFSSRDTFVMTARVTIPLSSSFDKVEEALRRLERERAMDVVIKPIRSRRAGRGDLVPTLDI